MNPLISRCVAACGLVLMVVLLGLLWSQHSEIARLKHDYTRLASSVSEFPPDAESRRLIPISHTANPAEASAPSGGHAGTLTASSGETSSSSESIPKGKGLKPWQKPGIADSQPHRDPTLNHLATGTPLVKESAGQLVTTIPFTPADTSKSLEKLAVVFRLPRTSEARIVSVASSDPANYDDVAQRISEDGKFAIFTGSIRDLKGLAFEVTLSRAEVMDVRGSCGITPFLLDVSANGAVVRNF